MSIIATNQVKEISAEDFRQIIINRNLAEANNKPIPIVEYKRIRLGDYSHILKEEHTHLLDWHRLHFRNCEIDNMIASGETYCLNLKDVVFENCGNVTLRHLEFSGVVFKNGNVGIDNCKKVEDCRFISCNMTSASTNFYSCNFDTDIFSYNHLSFFKCKFDTLKIKHQAHNIAYSSSVIKFEECDGNLSFTDDTQKEWHFEKCKITFLNSSLFNKTVTFSECDLNESNFRGSVVHWDLFTKHLISGKHKKIQLLGLTVEGGGSYEKIDAYDLSMKLLKEVTFKRLDLSNCSFRESNLERSRFSDVKLFNADFRRSNITDVVFEDANSADSRYFAGAKLLGAKPPENLKDFEAPLKLAEEAAKNARTLFITLIPICFYIAIISAFGIKEEGSVKLPIVTANLSYEGFFISGIIAICGLYVSLHIYLIKMFDQLSYLPEQFPNGAPLHERIYPWLLSSVVCLSYKRDKKHQIDDLLQVIIATLCGWVAPMTVVGALILNSQEPHHPIAWLITSAFFLSCIVFGFYSYFKALNIHKRRWSQPSNPHPQSSNT